MLDRRTNQLLRLIGKELVSGTLDGTKIAADDACRRPARPKRCHSAAILPNQHAHDGVGGTDINPKLERIRCHNTLYLTRSQRTLNLSAPLWQIAASISHDGVFRNRLVSQRFSNVLEHDLHARTTLAKSQRAYICLNQLGCKLH